MPNQPNIKVYRCAGGWSAELVGEAEQLSERWVELKYRHEGDLDRFFRGRLRGESALCIVVSPQQRIRLTKPAILPDYPKQEGQFVVIRLQGDRENLKPDDDCFPYKGPTSAAGEGKIGDKA